jgi:bifunctional non-homologous end joining protein LigD
LKTEREIAAADQTTPVVFYCFDMPHFAGIDLTRSPYRDRRRYLAQCLLPTSRVQLVHAVEDGAALQAAALASGFEGVVAKRKESGYEPGRRSARMVKPTEGADFVIGGYTQGKGSRSPLGAILVSYWGRKNPRQAAASHVNTGSTIARSRR